MARVAWLAQFECRLAPSERQQEEKAGTIPQLSHNEDLFDPSQPYFVLDISCQRWNYQYSNQSIASSSELARETSHL